MNKRAQFARQCIENRAVRNKGPRQLSRDAIRSASPEHVITSSGSGVHREFDCGIVVRISERRGMVPTPSIYGCTQHGGVGTIKSRSAPVAQQRSTCEKSPQLIRSASVHTCAGGATRT